MPEYADPQDKAEKLHNLLVKQERNIDKLTDSISNLTDSLVVLPTKKDNTRLQILVSGIVILALVISSFIGLRASHDNHRLLAKVNDCVGHNGQCYKEGQARTGKAVTLIINGVQCKVEYAIAKGFKDAGLPAYTISSECLQEAAAAPK